ncbi:MAG: hypothetical protein ACE5SW_12485 [Nitrososphaeraceae archaeon]|nr:hypothetical protein [Nitrosarchaeum sp.]
MYLRSLVSQYISSTSNLSISSAFAEPKKTKKMFAIQKTEKSMQDPLPGHEAHQVVIALPQEMMEKCM